MLNHYLSELRPWGSFERFTLNEASTVKIITVHPNQELSHQYHFKRDELWVFLDDNLQAKYGNLPFMKYHKGENIIIPRMMVHSLRALTQPGRVLEIAIGDFDENDIVRTDDRYGRIK